MWFDRYAKLKKEMPTGAVRAGLKEVMPLLRGRLEKSDPPGVVIQPANLDELTRTIGFASDKNLKIAIANGLSPASVRGLGEQILLLTSRFNGPSSFSGARGSIRVDAGMPVESLAVELASHGCRWLPLHPVPAGESIGSLIAAGWEGFRNWTGGGTQSNIRAIEWVGYDGRVYLTGSSLVAPDSSDLSSLLFGSRGKYGLITSVELTVKPLPSARTLMLFELPGAARAVELLNKLRAIQPQPETVVYFSEMATEILRSANDGTLTDKARVLVVADWSEDGEGIPDWERYARIEKDPGQVNALWQDLFRLPRTASRLAPHRTTARLKLPAASVLDLEERAKDLSRDYNLGVALWGTLEIGHLHVWILQPDSEPRTQRQALDLLGKLVEDSVRLGGCLIDSSPRLVQRGPETDRDELTEALQQRLLKQCDPLALYVPLRSA